MLTPDDPCRVAGPSELLSEQPKRLSDPDDKSGWNDGRYSSNPIADCGIAFERYRAQKLAQNYAEMQKMLPGVYKQAAALRRPTISDHMESMMDASERFFAATDAMFAPLHNKGD